jgi:hypothetical protein
MVLYRCRILGCRHESLQEAQRVHGICNAPDCDEPIAGWCSVCGLKVCAPLHGSRHGDDRRFVCRRCYWREKGETS